MGSINYRPIGVFFCAQSSPHESPMQGAMAKESVGVVKLNRDIPLESLKDLSSFERIWLLYDMNRNKKWKPLVQPPRGGEKRGVFGTRSPYRPNSIGMSCVKLILINGSSIEVSGHDLLDGTPVLDIKPYLSYADHFFVESDGWTSNMKKYEVSFTKKTQEKTLWLQKHLNINLMEIIKNQLSFEPINSKLKRVKRVGHEFEFSYKTWRFNFRLKLNSVEVYDLKSGYSIEELANLKDLYGDKEWHRQYLKRYS